MCDNNKLAINLLLLGRTQNGKSATGNTLLGSTDFASYLSLGSVTTVCSLGRSCPISNFARRQGRELTIQVRVLDTPGYPHSSLRKEQVEQEVKTALVEHFGESGLHLAFWVLRADVPLCEGEEDATIQFIQKLLGPSWKNYTVILFTHADKVEKARFSKEQYLQTASHTLNNLLQSIQQKCIFVDNDTMLLKQEHLKAIRKILEFIRQNHYQVLQFK